MRQPARRVLLGSLAVVCVWAVLEGLSAGTLALLGPGRAALPEDAPEWLVNARGAFERGAFIRDEQTIWRPRPGFTAPASRRGLFGQRALVTNSHGHRSPELDLDKPAGVRRVLVVGGSHPYGMWVETEEAYISVLGELLNSRVGPRWETINAACPGHTSFQGLAYLREYGVSFEPDVVIFDLGTNDSLPLSVDYASPDHEVAAVPGLVGLAVRAADRSFVYRLLRRLLQPLAGEADASAVRVPPERTRANREAAEQLARKHGFGLLHMTQVNSVVGPAGMAGCNDRLEGFDPVADICGLFEALEGDSGLYFHDPIHANAEGHRLIAETVLVKLDELGWTR